MRAIASMLVAVAATVMTSLASAQEVFGTLRREDSDIPSQGTVVVAERLSDGLTIARAVTGALGTWRLRITTEQLVIRALRIGFAPHVLDTVQLEVGDRRELHASLPEDITILPALRTATDFRCRVRPDSASLVARLFHEARTALAASQLISLDGPLRNRVRVSNETWSHDEKSLLETSHREYVSDSLRPFSTATVDSLLEFGFVARHLERFAGLKFAEEVAVDYRVPSADLLVDDRFLADYCLHLADARDDHPGWIGIGFRPARSNRRVTLIEGTIWLDRRSGDLQRLEFGYAGLSGNERIIAPGGWLEFTRLETGLWFVSRWALRMPALGSWVERSGGATLRLVTRHVPVVRVSGAVLDLAIDSHTVFTVGATEFLQAGTLIPVPALTDSTSPACGGTREQAFVVGKVFSATGAALPAALRFVWRADEGTGTDWLQTETVALSTGEYRVCGIPKDLPVTVEVRAAGHEPAGLALRIGSPRIAARLDLLLAPATDQRTIP